MKTFLILTVALLGFGLGCSRGSVDWFGGGGTSDDFFGSRGAVHLDFQGRATWGNGVGLQSDGKIVVGGYATSPESRRDLALFRLQSDGSRDGSFNAGTGQVILPETTLDDEISALAVQQDDKIVAVGTVGRDSSLNDSTGRFAVLRFLPDGSVDTTFGVWGKTYLSIDTDSLAFDVRVQPDGKIVIGGVGHLSTTYFALVRLEANGSLDPTFGDAGIKKNQDGTGGVLNGLDLQADGKLLAAGYMVVPLGGGNDRLRAVVARHRTGGERDTSFDGDGLKEIEVRVASESLIRAVARSDGKIICMGVSRKSASEHDLFLTRLESDGAYDASFGTNGRLLISLSAEDNAGGDLKLQGNQMVVSGKVVEGGVARAFVLRLNEDGSFDTSFNGTGKALLTVGSWATARSLAIARDGKIVVVGPATVDGLMRGFVARFWP